MRRLTTALIAALVVLSTAGAVPAAGVQADSSMNADVAVQEDGDETDGNETADNGTAVAPGERLAGVVGVQEAELDGELEARSFGLSVARAASDEARAALIAAKVNETNRDLDQLRERREQLREARENGSMSEGEYRARMAELGARSKNVERMANESENASRGLPEEILRANGVNVTAIQTLRDEARNMSGQEVAEIARSIAGVGQGVGERPEQARDRGGSGDRAGNATERGGQPTEVPTGDDAQTDGDATNSTDAGPAAGQDAGSDTADSSDGSDADTSRSSDGGAKAGGKP